jgi:hypothetical protein
VNQDQETMSDQSLVPMFTSTKPPVDYASFMDHA